MNYYEVEILKLEKRLEELKELSNEYELAKTSIKIGSVILDLEQNEVGVVTKLKNGSNDFEVEFYNSKIVGRGFNYAVKNWKLAI